MKLNGVCGCRRSCSLSRNAVGPLVTGSHCLGIPLWSVAFTMAPLQSGGFRKAEALLKRAFSMSGKIKGKINTFVVAPTSSSAWWLFFEFLCETYCVQHGNFDCTYSVFLSWSLFFPQGHFQPRSVACRFVNCHIIILLVNSSCSSSE